MTSGFQRASIFRWRRRGAAEAASAAGGPGGAAGAGGHGGADGISVTFAAGEVEVLRNLIGELVELLGSDQDASSGSGGADSAPGAGSSGAEPPADAFAALVDSFGGTDASRTPEPPEDEVLERLLPDAYPGDDEASSEFRRFTEQGLRDGKLTNAATVLESLGDPAYSDRVSITLDDAEAQAWLRTLTDLRLAVGTRLGVEQDDEERWASLPPEHPRAQVYAVYMWLGFLQETLVNALT